MNQPNVDVARFVVFLFQVGTGQRYQVWISGNVGLRE